MGFFNKLFGLGIAAGAGAAAVKVAEKVKENKPDGFADETGKTDAKAVVDEIAKAAGEVYQDAAEVVKEKAPVIAEKVKNAVCSLGDQAIDVDIEIIKDEPEAAPAEAPEAE